MLTKQEKQKLLDSIKAVIQFDGTGYDFIVDVLHAMAVTVPTDNHHHQALISSILQRAEDEVWLITTDEDFLKEQE